MKSDKGFNIEVEITKHSPEKGGVVRKATQNSQSLVGLYSSLKNVTNEEEKYRPQPSLTELPKSRNSKLGSTCYRLRTSYLTSNYGNLG